LEAVQTANENKIPVELCDREVRVTLRRAWHSMNLWQKSKFLSGGFAGLFEKQDLTEEKLAELRNKDVLSEMMDEIGKAMPVLKRIIIDERDQFIAQRMKESPGRKIVSVVGAGHVKGIVKYLENNGEVDLKSIEVIPEPSLLSKLLGWGIPFIIIASIFYIGFSQGITEAGNNALFWILACGIPSAIGSLISAAHPLTILASFVSAPITSLSPLIGVGYVAAFIQAYMQPPIVKEFQEVSKDFREISKWWKNRLLKVFLVFILSSIGGVIGTSVGFFEIVRNVFN
jgi:pheromone shutdown-related protein TraB